MSMIENRHSYLREAGLGQSGNPVSPAQSPDSRLRGEDELNLVNAGADNHE